MEIKPAEKLQKKKINKTKLKKTIKNVLSSPDPIFWPAATNDQKKMLDVVLNQHKVLLPEFKKPLWNDLKHIPKDKRLKPPKTEKVNGLIFGISECCEIIDNGQCSAIILEAAVNPRCIVQPVLESCVRFEIPVVCIEGLRKMTANNFGIPTSCLGVKKEYLLDISEKIAEIGSSKLPQSQISNEHKMQVEIETVNKSSAMDVQESIQFQYLYRTGKKNRVFVPPSDAKFTRASNKFIGQDFIEFSDKLQQNKKQFKKMIVKRIANNSNRVRVK